MKLKLIKFDLPINGTKVKNVDELRDNLTDEIITLARKGQLECWLNTRQQTDLAQAVAGALAINASDKDLFLAICTALDIQVYPDDVNALFDPPPEAGKRIAQRPEGEITSYGYIIHHDDTVTDPKTGLMWKQHMESGKYTYDDAVRIFQGRNQFSRYTDWRLPTKDELASLVHQDKEPCYCQKAFPDNKQWWFWSSSSPPDYSTHAWYVYFGNGNITTNNRSNFYHIRLVRSTRAH
jgi:hypothetical protein